MKMPIVQSRRIPVQPGSTTHVNGSVADGNVTSSNGSSPLDFLYNKAQGDVYSSDVQQPAGKPYYNRLLYGDVEDNDKLKNSVPERNDPSLRCNAAAPSHDCHSPPAPGRSVATVPEMRQYQHKDISTPTECHPMASRCDTGKTTGGMHTLVQRANSQMSVEHSRQSSNDDDTYYTPVELQYTTDRQSNESSMRTIDKSSIRQHLREGEDIGRYNQTSIRYTGKTNPSRLFKLLQSKTGSDSDTPDSSPSTCRRTSRQIQKEAAADDDGRRADDVVDIRYIGSNIPSRTFKNLLQAIGDAESMSSGSEDDHQIGTGRDVQVIHLRQTESPAFNNTNTLR